MANDKEEEIDEELHPIFETNHNFINVDKVNKDVKIIIKALLSENERLKTKVARLK